jgi:protein tyrosine/serine phosphatase
MIKKKQPLRGAIIILLIIAAATFLFDHFHINNFRTVEPGVFYTSGQPSGMDYTRLFYSYHIATIVSIRPASEHRDKNWRNEEIVSTRNNGINYIEMPIEKTDYFPDKQTQEQFLTVMANKSNLPVLLHGGRNDKRVAMLVAVWMVKSQKYTVGQTVNAVEKILKNRKPTEDEIKFIENLSK